MDKLIKLFTVVASMSTILLYFLGSKLWSSILTELGVESSLFEKSIEEYLIFSYTNIVVDNLSSLIFLTFIFFIFSSIIFILSKKIELFIRFFRIKSSKMSKLEFNIIDFSFLISQIGSVIFMVTIMPVFFAYVGMKNIEYTYTKDIKEKANQNKNIHLKDEVIKSVNIIAINNNYCAYYDGDKTITLKSENIIKIESKQ